jgi:hypothetical protein
MSEETGRPSVDLAAWCLNGTAGNDPAGQSFTGRTNHPETSTYTAVSARLDCPE